jgi:hypothetical protein
MINETDLEAFAEDLETADKIVERVKTGVPAGREIMADETMALIRAFVLMRDTAERSAKFMTELHQRELTGMDIDRSKE